MATVEQTIPLLVAGQRLTRAEFLRRWEAMPDLKRAELIHGVVHMPSPLSRLHGLIASEVCGWFTFYRVATPGVDSGLEMTWLMPGEETPQPDLTLFIRPSHGGQSSEVGIYAGGAPELLVEVAVSSIPRDLGDKLEVYRVSGVQEYLVVLAELREIRYHRLVQGQYQLRHTGTDGIWRSEMFPGLWLDETALFDRNTPRIQEVVRQGLATAEHVAFVQRLAQAQQQGGAIHGDG